MMTIRRIVPTIAAALLLVAMSVQLASASGTQANATVNNFATVNYTYMGNPSSTSALSSIRVDELINFTLVWQDAAYISVAPGDLMQVTTYDLTNLGNGNEVFAIALNSTVPSDEFDPSYVAIYMDTNGSGTYDGGDALYIPGGDPLLSPDEVLRLFVIANIPSSGLSQSNTSLIDLSAQSKTVTPPAPVGTVLAGAGDGGTFAVVAVTDGTQTAQGGYIVDNIVSIAKSASVIDMGLGTRPITGATVEYTLIVTVAGGFTAEGLTIVDAIPAGMTYVLGSITLDGVPQLDGIADGDQSDYNVTNAGSVTVGLGDVAGGSLPSTITFRATIN